MGQGVVRKRCLGCDKEIVSSLETGYSVDWYVLTADSYCKECIKEKPVRELCKKEMVKLARK